MEIALIVVLFVVAFVAAFGIATYNGLVKDRNNVKNAYAQIDTQMQRRFDLIPNLVEVVKGYAGHEKALLENVTASRAGYLNAASGGEKLECSERLSSTLRTLFAVAENYPQLKANTNFIELQNELSETEDKVTYARQFYNDAVTIYNTKLQMFPSSLIAGMFGFKEEELLEAASGAGEAPKVKF